MGGFCNLNRWIFSLLHERNKKLKNSENMLFGSSACSAHSNILGFNLGMSYSNPSFYHATEVWVYK